MTTIIQFLRRERRSANELPPDRLSIAILILGLGLFGGLAAVLAAFSQVR